MNRKKAGKTIKNIIIFTLIAGLLFVAALLVYGVNSKDKDVDYTSYNPGPRGVKAAYMLAGRMGYDTVRYERPARFLPDNGAMIVIKPDNSLFISGIEQKYLQQWVENGNALILVDEGDALMDTWMSRLAGAAGRPETGVFDAGKGKFVYFGNPEDFINEGLKSYTAGIELMEVLEKLGHKNVLFNEYYHNLGSGTSFLDIIGASGRLILIQIIIALGVLLFIKSRRIGAPTEVLQIIKRRENENLYALSNLYMKSKANTLVLQSYFEKLKLELSKFLGFSSLPDEPDLVKAASGVRFLNEMNIPELVKACNRYIESESRDSRQLFNLVAKIEKIRKGIR